MAKFKADGIDGLMLSLQEIAELPPEVELDIIQAGADVVIEEQKRTLKTMGLYRTGILQSSIMGFQKEKKTNNEKKQFISIYPYGVRKYRKRKLVTKVGYATRTRGARHYTVGGDVKAVTNAEIGFIHEFGAPKRGIPAKAWMRKANERAASDVVKAEERVYDKWLESKGLLSP